LSVREPVCRFFSNLLPEGPPRDYLAGKARVKKEREFFLIAVRGADLPGAVTVEPIDGGPDDSRSLDGVTLDQVRRLAGTTGLPVKPVWDVVRETTERTADAWRALPHKELLPAAMLAVSEARPPSPNRRTRASRRKCPHTTWAPVTREYFPQVS
jgi:hypothetical protein